MRPSNPAIQRISITDANPTPTALLNFRWETRADASSGEVLRAQPTPAPVPGRRPGRFPRQNPFSGFLPGGGSSGTGGSSQVPDGGNQEPGGQGSDAGQSSGGSSGGQSSGGSSQPTSQPSSPVSPTSAQPTSQPQSDPTTSPTSPTQPPSSEPSNPPSSEPPSSTSQPPSSISSSDTSTSMSLTQSGTPTQTNSLPVSDLISSPMVPSDTDTSSGIRTTIFSTIVTDVNGQRTTITSAIPTTLPYPTNAPSSADKRSIIIGCAIGGTAFAVIVVMLVVFLRRSSKVSLNYKKLRVFGRGRRKMLEDEDEDDWLGGGEVGMTTRYRDYPPSVASSSRPFGAHSRDISASGMSLRTVPRGGSPAPSPLAGGAGIPPDSPFHPPQPTSPYLMGPRASSSGSIFHEAVWPPPGEGSRFVDPLVADRSLADLVDLAGITPSSTTATPSGSAANTSVPSGSGSAAQAQYPPAEAMSPVAGPSTSALAAFDLGHSRLPSYGTAVAQGATGGLISEDGHRQGANLSPSSTYTSARTEKSRGKARPPPALQQSWQQVQNQPADPALYDFDPYAESSATAGRQALRVRNASPTSPNSPASTVGQPGGFAAAQGDVPGGPSSPKNWLNRPVRKDV